MTTQRTLSPGHILIPLAGVLCLLPIVNSAVALLAGVMITLFFGNPYSDITKQWTHRLLSYSVIGLGAGMNLITVAQVGLQGIGYTILSIAFTLILGFIIGRQLKVARDTSLLVSVGTAICGGSAIAAVAPAIRAKSHEVSVALGIVFMLNAAALFIFPMVGHHFGLSQHQFGLWSALAIHDTSSVVGASLQYGAEALQVGTTVKLARALWIVPLTFGFGWYYARHFKNEVGASKPKKPWFILGFLLAAALVTFIPALQPVGSWVETIAKRTLVLTLFLIGSNLSKETLKQVGVKPFIQGVLLWLIVGTSTFLAIYFQWIGA